MQLHPWAPAVRLALGREGSGFVKTAVFGYHAARSVEEAVELLAAYEGTARLLAGGQSLVPMMNMRLIRPDALIDVNGLSDLDGIEFEDDTTVIGALTRYTTLEHSSIIADRLPLVARMVRHIGDRQVRNRGTIGGSLVQGDPTGEMPLACTTLGASVRSWVPAAGARSRSRSCTRAPMRRCSTRSRW